jgi:hypothetical protein
MRELDALAGILAARTTPVNVFFRDDDVGWYGDRLRSLCETFSEADVELDLAVIPAALDRAKSADLIRLSRQHAHVLNFHQHGYAHVNHQTAGRKCEFGSDRGVEVQRRDIERGRGRMREVLGELVDPIFTPPWNRCTRETSSALQALDFMALSRILGSAEVEHFGLTSIPVSIDWEKKRGGVKLSWAEFCLYAERFFHVDKVVGVMLHHEHMAADNLYRLSRFIDTLRDSGKVIFRSMLSVVESIRDEQKGAVDAHI